MAKCICIVHGDTGSSHSSSIHGVLRLSQQSEDAPTIIEGEIRGLAPGKHGISINVYGDSSNASSTCGAIFNPFSKNHGGPGDEVERMVGDLGNITVTEEGKCLVHMEDKCVKLIGPHSVIGRSVVIYANEDDCGRGGHELSLMTGNSGPRIACGVIGITH